MKKRILSLTLALCMVFTMLPTAAFATESSTPIGISDVTDSGNPAACTHEHDAVCGYIEAKDAQPCRHLNEDGTFSCAPVLDSGNTATTGDADKAYVCDHSDHCGYQEAVVGADCIHKCELCKPETPASKCNCTVKCIPADEKNGVEKSINYKCPVCGAAGADLAAVCKGTVAMPMDGTGTKGGSHRAI